MAGFTQEYRPHSWRTVIGNERIVEALKSECEKDKPKRTYLFGGETGSGKTTLARIFASYIMSKDGKQIKDIERHPDYREINVGDNNGIDMVRQIAMDAKYKPVRAKYRVIMLDEVQGLGSAQAKNAILKVLEEPPEHTIFILASMSPESIDRAIKTRCMTFNLESPTEETITELVKYVAKKEKLKWVSDKFTKNLVKEVGCNMRTVLTTLEQLAELPEIKKNPDKAHKYIERALGSALEGADKINANILISIYKGDAQNAYACAMEITGNEYSSLLSLIYINKYLIDRKLCPQNKKVAHWGINKQVAGVIDGMKVNVDDFTAVQMKLLSLRYEFSGIAPPANTVIPIAAYELAKRFSK